MIPIIKLPAKPPVVRVIPFKFPFEFLIILLVTAYAAKLNEVHVLKRFEN